ncbi:hypothetical protein CDD83_3606 [Cordyceps sp. RAO-2017]|nr:hypothetical protein CDD83_3606 [Cordyceps sp. RAO-2017]
MSAPAPQVLSRRANGAPHAPAGQPTDPPAAKGKSTLDAYAQRPSRARGSGDRGADGNARSANAGEAPKRSKPRPHNEGEKLVVRRLPPGMTEAEFVSALGPEWEVNKGKVDWFSYCIGKVASDPSKLSRPSRAYLHLTRKDDMMALSQAVRAATWEDASGTFTSSSLIGPPSLEFSTYKKVPGSRRRTDPRQGTIDQDQEFMAFLEGLANPAPPRESVEVEDADETAKEDGNNNSGSGAKVTTTPLVEFLKEKKANKGKDGAAGKNAKSGN